MKKIQIVIFFIMLTAVIMACLTATPLPPITAEKGVEFTLAPDQTATIADTGITIRFIGVGGDQRCPSEIECAMSGPVSISLSVQMSDGEASDINMQTFTSNDGRAPEGPFEGIQDRVEYEGYLIRIMGVLPYPRTRVDEIKDNEYRVTLMVTKK
jgi:hypothetical protein